MNDDERDEVVAELIDRPQEREVILHDAEVTSREQVDLREIAKAADMLWLAAQGSPPVDDDPVAALLGLVPDTECRIDPRSLARARKRSRLRVSDIATRLRERGWEFGTSDVFRWETRSAADVPPAVVQALSEILGASVDDLISSTGSMPLSDDVSAVRADPLFAQLVDRWAQARHVSRAVATSTLESRMLATVHRGDRPDTEQLLRSLNALVTSIEHADEG